MARVAEVASLALRSGRWTAAAHTRPAFYAPPGHVVPNVDNVLLTATIVGGETSVVMAVAHGNYKDNRCAVASEAAMQAADAELAVPHLAEADVGPALQRALLRADERISSLAEAPLPSDVATELGPLLETCFGRQKHLRGIGASMVALVATPRHAFVAHAGECAALLVHANGETRHLVRAHTLATTPHGRAEIAKDPSQRAWLEDVVLNLVGFGEVQTQVTRAPLVRGDRIVLGNAGLRKVDDFTGPPEEACARIAAALTRVNEFAPATLAIADLG